MSEAGVSTLGEYLYLRRQSGHTVRSRLVGQGTKAQYEFYPDRSIVEDEFFRLWNAQAAYHPNLSDSARDEFHKIIFYQRPLKPVQPGRCTLEPTKERAPQAFPVSQWFRIYQELNQLRVVTPELHERELTFSERNTLAAILKQGKDLTFESLRTRLKLAPGHAFNLEGESRDKLKGDSTAYLLAKKDHFGPAWHELSPESQHDVVELLLEEESEDTLVAALMGRWQLDEKNARAIAALNLPAGYSRLCLEALCSITKELVQTTSFSIMKLSSVQDMHHIPGLQLVKFMNASHITALSCNGTLALERIIPQIVPRSATAVSPTLQSTLRSTKSGAL